MRAAAPHQLRHDQYRDADRLEARIALHRGFSVNPKGWTRWLFEQIELPPEAAVLEIGCGPGTLWGDNAARIPSGWDVTLSDFSPGMVAAARGRLAGVRGFAFEVAEAARIPHPDASFDALLANHMLYHVPDREIALAEIRRVLRPGGRLVASTLSRQTLHELEGVVREASARADFRLGSVSGAFALDDGASQLSPFFDPIETRRYEDALEITEVEPVLAYLRSMILDTPLREPELDAIGRRVGREIEAHGAFHVSKDAGVFLARARA